MVIPSTLNRLPKLIFKLSLCFFLRSTYSINKSTWKINQFHFKNFQLPQNWTFDAIFVIKHPFIIKIFQLQSSNVTFDNKLLLSVHARFEIYFDPPFEIKFQTINSNNDLFSAHRFHSLFVVSLRYFRKYFAAEFQEIIWAITSRQLRRIINP